MEKANIRLFFLTNLAPARPVHHRRHRKSMCLIFRHFPFIINSLRGGVCTPFYGQIRHVSTAHCTHKAHENGRDLKTPFRFLARPGQTQGALYQRDRPSPRRCGGMGSERRGQD